MTRTTEGGSVGVTTTRTARLFTAESPLVLASGAELGPVDVAYETYGTLAPVGSHAGYLFDPLTRVVPAHREVGLPAA